MFQGIELQGYVGHIPRLFAFWINLGWHSAYLATIELSSPINSTDCYISLQLDALSKFWHLWAAWHLDTRSVSQLLIELSPTDSLTFLLGQTLHERSQREKEYRSHFVSSPQTLSLCLCALQVCKRLGTIPVPGWFGGCWSWSLQLKLFCFLCKMFGLGHGLG